MRVYIVGMAALVIEMGSIVLLLRQGGFALRVAACALAFSVAVSWAGAHAPRPRRRGAGSVLAVYLDRFVMLRRISRLTGVPLRRLQDWRASRCAPVRRRRSRPCLGWIVAERLLAGHGPLARLAAGSALIARLSTPAVRCSCEETRMRARCSSPARWCTAAPSATPSRSPTASPSAATSATSRT